MIASVSDADRNISSVRVVYDPADKTNAHPICLRNVWVISTVPARLRGRESGEKLEYIPLNGVRNHGG